MILYIFFNYHFFIYIYIIIKMSTDKKIFLGYISYYIKNLDPLATKTEWKKYLKNKFKTDNVSKVDAKDARNVALTLYYSHIVSLVGCINNSSLIFDSKKSYKDFQTIMVDFEAVREKHKLPELPVVHYLNDAKAIKHMEEFQDSVSTVKQILSDEPEKKVVKKSTAKKTKTTKTSTKKPVKKTTKKVKIPEREGRESKSETCKIVTKQKCDSYKITELKKIAADKNIAGRSKMNKQELCKALKIK